MRNVAVGNDDCREAPVAVVTACSVLVLFIAVIVFVTATSGYLDAGIAGKCRVSWLEIIALSWYCWLKAKKGCQQQLLIMNRKEIGGPLAIQTHIIGALSDEYQLLQIIVAVVLCQYSRTD